VIEIERKKHIIMKSKQALVANLIILGLIILGMLSRFLINIPNVSAIGAIALFSGAYFSNKKLAIALPISILFLSDLVLGLHSTMIFVYASVILIIMMGFLLRNKKSILRIITGSLIGSVLFYLITNFGVWMTGMGISPTLAGVYADGIPFFRNMLIGDLLFNGILFGSAYLIFEKAKVLQKITA
jgi:hypothetical protein